MRECRNHDKSKWTAKGALITFFAAVNVFALIFPTVVGMALVIEVGFDWLKQ